MEEETRVKLHQYVDHQYEMKEDELRTFLRLMPRFRKAVDDVPLPHAENIIKIMMNTTWTGEWGVPSITIRYPRSITTLRNVYKELRILGWTRSYHHEYSGTYSVHMRNSELELELHLEFVITGEGSQCVRVPTKFETKEVAVEHKVYCSDANPEYFEEDENGQMLYVGPGAENVGM